MKEKSNSLKLYTNFPSQFVVRWKLSIVFFLICVCMSVCWLWAWSKSFQSHLFASVFRWENNQAFIVLRSHHWVISQMSSTVPLSIYEWHLNGVHPNRYTAHNTQKTYGNSRAEFTVFWHSVWRRVYAVHFKSQNEDDEREKGTKKRRRTILVSTRKEGKISKLIFDFLFFPLLLSYNRLHFSSSRFPFCFGEHFSFSFRLHFVWLQSDNVTHI